MRPDHIRGSSEAVVTLVGYGDYRCALCARAARVIDVVMAELGDSIRFVFRNLPRSGDAAALTAAEAAESVATHAGSEAFWRMQSILFENPDALEIDDLLAYAEAAGADPRQVANDLSSGAMRRRILREADEARRAGAVEAPAFFVNGLPLEVDWMDVDAFVDELRRHTPIPS
jgi:formate-nitrite transporter family protein